jgi:tetratricopeptide (TPR) repeat protein
MILNRFLFALLLSISAFAQNDYDFHKSEMDTRKLVYNNPDAALPIIKRTLAQRGDLHDTVYGNTYHLYGVYHSMKGNQDSTIYYINKSIGYLKEYPRIRARSLFTISMAHRKKAEYKTALKYLDQIADINEKEKNIVGQAMVYGEMASNYNQMLNYDKSIDLLVKAVEILKAEKNTKQIVAVKQKLANTYLAKENYPFAIDLYRECLVGFKAMGADKNYYLTQVNMGEALIKVKKYAEAKKVLLEGAEGLKKFGDKEMIGIAYSKLGNLERALGNNAKAAIEYKKAMGQLLPIKSTRAIRIGGEYIALLNYIDDYKEALAVIASIEALKNFESANIQDRMVYKNAIANTYEATQNERDAIKAYQHTIAIKDSIANREKESAVQEIQAKFQTELQREKNVALEANNKVLVHKVEAEKKLLFLYIAVSIAIILVTLLFLRSYKLKNRLQKEELRTVEAEKELIQQQQLFEQQLVTQQKATIDEKQRELTSTALRMANYQDTINLIIEKCETGELSKVTDVKKELQQLMKQKDYWKQFETRFNNLHPEFNVSLTNKYDKLTKNDLEFCSLLKLNLSNKEIASLLQISHESVITKKYRIKKKMEINDDQEFEKILTAI